MSQESTKNTGMEDARVEVPYIEALIQNNVLEVLPVVITHQLPISDGYLKPMTSLACLRNSSVPKLQWIQADPVGHLMLGYNNALSSAYSSSAAMSDSDASALLIDGR